MEAEPLEAVSIEIDDDGKRGALPSVSGTHTRRRSAEQTSPPDAHTSSSAVAITTQEGIGRYRVTAMIGASVELDSTMEMLVDGRVLKRARHSKFSGGASSERWSLTLALSLLTEGTETGTVHDS